MRAFLSLWHVGAALQLQGLLFSCSVWVSHCSGFSRCRAEAQGPSDFSSCGARAQLLLGMWGLSSLIRDQTCIACIARRILYWTTREVCPSFLIHFLRLVFWPNSGSILKNVPCALEKNVCSGAVCMKYFVPCMSDGSICSGV